MAGIKASPEELKLRRAKKLANLAKANEARKAKKALQPAKLNGRPTSKTNELCEAICQRISLGETMTAICQDAKMPAVSTVWHWAEGDDTFAKMLTGARKAQANVWVDKVKDELTDDQLQTHEAIGRARLRFNYVQWASGKYDAKFADQGKGTTVNVGVQVVLPEAERLKLIERHERAMLANSVNTVSTD